ncbi:MAG: site-specific integrase [Oceanobacter sp.]
MPLIHYVLTPRPFHGFTIHRLKLACGTDFSVEYEPYTKFMEGLVLNGKGKNVLKDYGARLANFLDYLYEGELQCEAMDAKTLERLIIGYHSYLTEGKGAQDELIAAIAKTRPQRIVKDSTSAAYHVPIAQFIEESAIYHSNLIDQMEMGLVEPYLLDNDTLFYSGIQRTALPRKQQQAINSHSVIAAVVCGGAKMKRERLFKHLPSIASSTEEYENYQHFPLDKIPLVIQSATSARNAALWSLWAATGVRPVEGLQLLWEDIDCNALEVVIRRPLKRNNRAEAYKGLNEEQKKKLCWKGRKTKHTMMLEPYATLFFEYLMKYLDEEYIAHGRHNFVFQKLKGDNKGSPLFLSDYGSSIIDPLHAAQRRVIKNERLEGLQSNLLGNMIENHGYYGPHSMRHSFCFFLKNYAKRPDGAEGLSDSEIMLLTGHQDSRSVERYAKVDLDRLRLIMTHANQAILGEGFKSLDEYRVEYLEKELKKAKEHLRIEQQVETKAAA